MQLMRDNLWSTSIALVVLLFVSGITWAQVQGQTRTLVINGQSGQTEVVEIDGRVYVDLAALAQISNGSLHFEARRIILNLPMPSVSTTEAPATVPPPSPVDDAGLSRDFMRAGIEELATMREWASTLAYAIKNGYQVTEDWAANYREQAAHNLRLASAAAVTDGDRNALQLLTNEFEAVRQWSDKLVQEKKSMDTAKYALSPNALQNDPQSQKIVSCGRFLAAMLGSASFQDDPSCH
jgi:hypothetical protein